MARSNDTHQPGTLFISQPDEGYFMAIELSGASSLGGKSRGRVSKGLSSPLGVWTSGVQKIDVCVALTR